jgi:HPt (histidine-containing phosphotransfer) domain-containing protein
LILKAGPSSQNFSGLDHNDFIINPLFLGAAMDFKTMASKLGFGDDDFNELVRLLVTTSQSELLTVEKELALGSNAGIGKAAHSIKGAAGNLGFMHMAAVARELEILAKQGNTGNMDKIRKKAAALKADLDLIKKAGERAEQSWI